MQIKSLRLKSYRGWRIDDTPDAAALDRLKRLQCVVRLREDGCGETTALSVVEWSRANIIVG